MARYIDACLLGPIEAPATAPTDAALGAGVMVNPAVPARIRRLLNGRERAQQRIATPDGC
jgi:hypothetical protein